MKTAKIIYWISTGLIFLFEGVMPAFTFNQPQAVEGIRHLGYPDYFRTMLTVFKVVGAIVLVAPFFKGRYKEWAYAGFGIDFIAAAVSIWAVDGLNSLIGVPVFAMAILTASYMAYQKINPKS